MMKSFLPCQIPRTSNLSLKGYVTARERENEFQEELEIYGIKQKVKSPCTSKPQFSYLHFDAGS